jgi:acyl carrier protein
MFAQSEPDDPVTAALRPEVEACIRALIADHLGVDSGQVTSEISLVEDLAADSLDLVELALAIEGHLGVVMPFYFLDRIRSYGDLVEETLGLVRGSRKRTASRDDGPVPLHARITPAGEPPPWTVERVMLLTPYAAQTLSDDALRAGWGARLELTLAADASDGSLARVRGQFPRLGDRGVTLDVRREQRVGVRRQSAA